MTWGQVIYLGVVITLAAGGVGRSVASAAETLAKHDCDDAEAP